MFDICSEKLQESLYEQEVAGGGGVMLDRRYLPMFLEGSLGWKLLTLTSFQNQKTKVVFA